MLTNQAPKRIAFIRVLGPIVLLVVCPNPPTPQAITTYHYDNLRTGWNRNETQLIYAAVSGPAQHLQHHVEDLSRLPDVLSLEIRRRHFDRPRRVTRKGVDYFVSDAVEFEVKVSEAFPIRALGPALWVGNEALTSADADGLTYHFFAFEPNKLEPNARISLGWSSASERRKVTPYRFTMPGEK